MAPSVIKMTEEKRIITLFCEPNNEVDILDYLRRNRGATSRLFEKYSLLSHAILANHSDTLRYVKILYDNGADIYMANDDAEKSLPTGLAGENGRTDILEFLLGRGAALGYSLHLAIKENPSDLMCIEKLLSQGFSLNREDENGDTPLHLAICNGNLNLLQLLFRYNEERDPKERLNINALNSEGETPFMQLVEKTGETFRLMADFLLQHGANMEIKTPEGFSALHMALRKGNNNLDMIDYCILHGMDINQADNEEKTLMHYIANDGVYEFSHQNDLYDNIDPQGSINMQMFLDMYSEQPRVSAEEKAGEKAVEPQFVNNKHVPRKKIRFIRSLADKGVDLEKRDNDGKTPLFYAARNGQPRDTKLFLSLGANPFSYDGPHNEEIYRYKEWCIGRNIADPVNSPSRDRQFWSGLYEDYKRANPI